MTRGAWFLTILVLGIILATALLAAGRMEELSTDNKAAETRAERSERRLERICQTVNRSLELYRKIDRTEDPEWKSTAQTVLIVYEPIDQICHEP